ncbi:LANO_0D09582g1_1 [Lachancea nothofagi CBS 11611]|uniref:LANO_0D09582g1_1 n=1 Tax=Lachancea nothofagi CBS 11611 TaxID=1266666 RepID=A0A1G4JJK9_9SACH|nr:LANO_0D09582g1_1 [Lachancea nothofagi CBS 11611]
MSKLDVSCGPNAVLKTQSSDVLYRNASTGLKASQTTECLGFIRDKILPAAMSDLDFDSCFIRYVTKNTKTGDYATEMIAQLAQKKTVVVYSYGSHIQRAVTTLELVKSRAKLENLEQKNTLDRFVNVVPGRNELLDRKINLPILISIVSQKDK